MEQRKIKIAHPEYGHVVFSNLSIRQREIIEHLLTVKRTLEMTKPFIGKAMLDFNAGRF